MNPGKRLAFALFVVACAPSDDDPGELATDGDGDSPSAGGESGDPREGEALFGSLCSPCHGSTGEGTPMGYELRHPVRDYATWVVRNGRDDPEIDGAVMAAYGTQSISDVELDGIWAYLDGFPQPTGGEGLYLDYCRNCHGPDAAGGVVEKDLRGRSFGDSLEKARQGAGGGAFDSRELYMPALDESVLTDDEVHAIAQWLETNDDDEN